MREVQARLADNIEPIKAYRFSLFNAEQTKLYEGKIIGTSFEIRRIISYRNSFLPVIKGELSTYLNRTEISVRMRPVTIVLVFISSWLLTVGQMCVLVLPTAISQFIQNGYSPGIHLPFIMFAFGYALLTLGYRLEAEKSKAFLETLLEVNENELHNAD